MKLTKHSANRLMTSLQYWRVPRDFSEPMFNYLVHGFEPGSFFKGWYANDASSIIHSHPGNSVEALKDLMKWMLNCMPGEAWGSHEKVNAWLKMDSAERRAILERYNLVYTEADEIVLLLKSEPTQEPCFWD